MKRLTSDQSWLGSAIQNVIDLVLAVFGKDPDKGALMDYKLICPRCGEELEKGKCPKCGYETKS